MKTLKPFIEPGKKLAFVAKIFTTFSSSDTLIVTDDSINDFLFEIRFADGTGRDTFNKLLENIDLNGLDMNWAKFTIENLFSQKQRDKMKKAREKHKETAQAKGKRMSEWAKAELLRANDQVKDAENWLKIRQNDVKRYKKTLKEYQEMARDKK